MNRLARIPRWQAFVTLVAGLGLAAPGMAQIIGSPNTATADPPVPRPSTTPCEVPLFTDLTFADFSPKPFTYTPPAACPGPWAKVVLEADFSVTAGRQFDRTAQIALGHANIYYGTTAEPSRTVSPSWHVERDLTDYSPLFQTPQAGDVNLGNLVNPTFTGIIHGSATVQFYPLAPSAPAPRTADVVLPMSDAPGGAALLATTTSTLAPTFSLPTNVEGAFLDVITQSQSSDEFWYSCVPDDVADELFSCPGTAFREAEITIDGQPAGVAPVYPWIFTGGIDPLLWRPIPDVQTLNFVPYRVDLTPFAGVLSNGQPHQVGLRVFNADHYFLVAASLLLYLDHGSAQVTGAVTRNTLGDPRPVVKENLITAADGSITGTVKTEAQREFTIAGYVDTSHGRVETTVHQEIGFSNDQRFVVSNTQYVQDITQSTRISAETESKGGSSVPVHTERQLSYPLSLDISLLFNADGSFSQTTAVDQSFNSQQEQGGRVANTVQSQDTLLFSPSGAVTGFQDRKSSQSYVARSDDTCYSRSITAENGLLTTITDGKGCGGHDD